MKTLYLDIFSGISGDMFIGALIDLGVDPQALEQELRKLPLEGYHLHTARRNKLGIHGVKFDVHLEHEHDHDHAHSHEHGHGHEHSHSHTHRHGEEHPHHHEHEEAHTHEHTHTHSHSEEGEEHAHTHGRTYSEIRALIQESTLSDWVKEKALAVFHRVAVEEAKIHGVPVETVGFHEVGAVDSIVDIVGGCIGLELLGRPRVLASPVVEGTGMLRCAHGMYPIPAPATLGILAARGVPVTQCDEPHELVTPTGAALLAEFVESFGPMREFVPSKTGFGVGTRDNRTRPNVLRAILGTDGAGETAPEWERDTVTICETNVDDLNPEILGAFVEKALVHGALDVFYTPIQMKKNRPGVLLTVLCQEADADRFCQLMLEETSAFGVRRYTAERRKLLRAFGRVATPFGEVEVKHGRLGQRIVQSSPEFESCKQVAEQAGVPLKEVYAAASAALRPAWIAPPPSSQ